MQSHTKWWPRELPLEPNKWTTKSTLKTGLGECGRRDVCVVRPHSSEKSNLLGQISMALFGLCCSFFRNIIPWHKVTFEPSGNYSWRNGRKVRNSCKAPWPVKSDGHCHNNNWVIVWGSFSRETHKEMLENW